MAESMHYKVTVINIQRHIWSLVQWTQHNTMAINTNKTKQLIISFSKKVNITDIPLLCINGSEIDRVTTFKLLGMIISSDLSWDSHVTYILHEIAKRMYCINYLVRSGVPTFDILCVYCSVIRSVLEYACAVWHPGLTKQIISRYWECSKALFKVTVILSGIK